jgi:hypothetical protein
VAEYRVPLDIANRALDHCGVPNIAAFTDDAKGAQYTNAVYDKLRVAELRRNVWRFSVRKAALRAVDEATMFLVPAAWSSTAVYPQGSIITYNNTFYFAAQYVPANTPPGSPDEAYWTVYFGPQTVTKYDSTTQYYAGELVYNVVAGTVNVYQCLISGTADDPTLGAIAWDAATTYNIGDTVSYASSTWQSKVDLNTNNTPSEDAYWTAVPVTNQAATQIGQGWLQINATVRYQRFQYPIDAGPRDQSASRNVFRLPYGFLREAPQDPKQGVASYLGAPSGLPYDDWVFEGDYITTSDSQVIILRSVADIQDVSQMDPMFCEGLAARIGLEICEPLTQSDSKLGTISQIYKTMMGDARNVNGIETGSVEPPLDDYITCRL